MRNASSGRVKLLTEWKYWKFSRGKETYYEILRECYTLPLLDLQDLKAISANEEEFVAHEVEVLEDNITDDQIFLWGRAVMFDP